MERDFAERTPKLGFGLMRLPKRADGGIDIERTKAMADAFLEAGFTYFDTAYVYDNGDSERAARAALVERHPRECFRQHRTERRRVRRCLFRHLHLQIS